VSGINASAEILPDSPSDHWPILVTVMGRGVSEPTVNIKRRNFKRLTRTSLENALGTVDWSPIYSNNDVDEIASFLINHITEALNLLCPLKTIRVRKGDNLYLSAKTRGLMIARDRAKQLGLPEYPRLRNEACKEVRGDRIASNLAELQARPDDQRLVWQLANQALGQVTGGLPPSITTSDGRTTVGDADAAAAINDSFVQKIIKLRASIPENQLAQNLPRKARTDKNKNVNFAFKFASAGRIAKTIKSLKNSRAAGIDGIPVLVYKLGAEVLAGPIARMVNVSLATGIVPKAFKRALVIPIHKGKGKSHTDPASYRPVSLLPTISKILESVVKEDLEDYFALVEALPDSQFGFRAGLSTTTALAAAHASWLEAGARSGVLGILAFDLSAAFDTVNRAQLIPKLHALGVGGVALDWFNNYLTGGEQAVLWNDTTSHFNQMEHGIRQGSVLSGLLFIALIADMPKHVGDDLTGYADDTCVWSTANTLGDLKDALELRASAFSRYAASCGLVMNGDKTQLMVVGKKAPDDFSVMVNGSNVLPGDSLELLGVKYDKCLSSRPQQRRVAASTRQRASTIARLSHQLPRCYLGRLAHGLVLGKIGYALAAYVRPRMTDDAPPHSADIRAAQVALNDVARSITGHRRTDHIKIDSLLSEAGIPSLNQVLVRSIATEAWKSFNSNDGADNSRNMLGRLLFPNDDSGHKDRQMRSLAEGKIAVPLRGHDTFITHAAHLWNGSDVLRAATTKAEATAIAFKLSLDVP
jgi:hypothetical protein